MQIWTKSVEALIILALIYISFIICPYDLPLSKYFPCISKYIPMKWIYPKIWKNGITFYILFSSVVTRDGKEVVGVVICDIQVLK